MLLDDEKFDQLLYKRIIARSDLVDHAIGFQYPHEALEYLKDPENDPIEVLFLDINMPRMSGFEFLDRACEEIGPAFAKVVVIMLTTSLDPKDMTRAKEFDQIKAFLNKPMKVGDIQTIAELVAQEQSLEA
ncbi:response regulator [Alphaproteobacteria bacterium KMM 3653]|uniref:Response regulator n=2 Tax=Harenicola maris TaxID=2841044 RepID=A0AAP2CQN0_9RHOB|nr:response regulator [Harenicola maris]